MPKTFQSLHLTQDFCACSPLPPLSQSLTKRWGESWSDVRRNAVSSSWTTVDGDFFARAEARGIILC